jgi:hypothetical protein
MHKIHPVISVIQLEPVSNGENHYDKPIFTNLDPIVEENQVTFNVYEIESLGGKN